jgi:hypothetical protein
MAGMSIRFIFGVLQVIASIGFFVAASKAQKAGNARASGTRTLVGISMLLLAAYNFIGLG